MVMCTVHGKFYDNKEIVEVKGIYYI